MVKDIFHGLQDEISRTAVKNRYQSVAMGARRLPGLTSKFENSTSIWLSRSEWRQRYGQDFKALARAKRRYDPCNLLASGPDIF